MIYVKKLKISIVSFAVASVGFTLTAQSVKVSSELVEVCVSRQGYGFTVNISSNSSNLIGKLVKLITMVLTITLVTLIFNTTMVIAVQLTLKVALL